MTAADRKQLEQITQGVREYLRSIGKEEWAIEVAKQLIGGNAKGSKENLIRVVSAIELDSGQRQEIRGILENEWQLSGEMEFAVNPKLLGGIKIFWGDKIIDLTVRKRLEDIYAA